MLPRGRGSEWILGSDNGKATLYVNGCGSVVVVESKWQWSARLEGGSPMKEQWRKEPGESFFSEDWSNLRIEIEEKELRNIEVVVFLLLRLSA